MVVSSRPELKEFAAAPGGAWAEFYSGARLSDQIVRSEGFSGHASAYSLFEEMEDKDPHLASALQTRKLGVLACKTRVEAAGADERDVRIARWVEQALAAIPGWNQALLHLLDALSKGMSVLEILWEFDAAGSLVPRGLKPRAAGRFGWSHAAGWRLLEAASAPGQGLRALPENKFIIALSGAGDERPYGKGLCERVYWYWWFKKHNIKFWLIYNEKFGAPTIVARHRPGLSEPERARLLEVIDSIQNDAGVTLPEGIGLELLESSRSGSAETYRALAQWCNDEISRAVLGQTLTGSEGQRSGSMALGKVHEEVRREYIRADAALLMDAVNHQLIRPLVALNFGAEVTSPRWTIDLSPALDLREECEIDRQLLQMGVSLPVEYFYEKYGRPAPAADGTRQLQYDDANLYQYHLQFGILTVNEVRARLGLPPLKGGDVATSPADKRVPASFASGEAGEDQPHGGVGEGEKEQEREKGR